MLNRLESECPEKFNKFTVWAKIDDKSGGSTFPPRKNNAIFTTYDGSKGMERDICVVMGVNLPFSARTFAKYWKEYYEGVSKTDKKRKKKAALNETI